MKRVGQLAGGAPWTRRAFLGGTGAWLCGGLWAGKPPREVRTVSIFHTTDLHGHIRPTLSY